MALLCKSKDEDALSNRGCLSAILTITVRIFS